MSKSVYCSNCGQRLPVIRKAYPKLGRIIEMIEPHECTEEPQQLDLTPLEVPTFQQEAEGKFVQSLNNLYNQPKAKEEGSLLGNGLKDRRTEDQIKSSAPPSVLDTLKTMQNTTPEKDPTNEPE